MLGDKVQTWTLEQGTSELVSEEIDGSVQVSVLRCSWLERPYIWQIARFDRTGGVAMEFELDEARSFATAEDCAAHAWSLIYCED